MSCSEVRAVVQSVILGVMVCADLFVLSCRSTTRQDCLWRGRCGMPRSTRLPRAPCLHPGLHTCCGPAASAIAEAGIEASACHSTAPVPRVTGSEDLSPHVHIYISWLLLFQVVEGCV